VSMRDLVNARAVRFLSETAPLQFIFLILILFPYTFHITPAFFNTEYAPFLAIVLSAVVESVTVTVLFNSGTKIRFFCKLA